jgi:hypothetical protein
MNNQEVIIRHDVDSVAIPIDRVIEAFTFMKYGSVCRVMFTMLFLTGCRISELDVMLRKDIIEGMIYWFLGKNQHGMRKEKLPDWYLEELACYWKHSRTYSGKVFGVNSQSFVKMFNKDIRPKLSEEWQHKKYAPNKNLNRMEHIYQIKGLRKDYQTMEFARQYEKWGDAHVALEWVSKMMQHSSARITAYHYIENFENLHVDRYKKLTQEKILYSKRQTRLYDFM